MNFLWPREKDVRQSGKWMNTKLTIFKDLYRQAKHKFSKFVHTAKCEYLHFLSLRLIPKSL